MSNVGKFYSKLLKACQKKHLIQKKNQLRNSFISGKRIVLRNNSRMSWKTIYFFPDGSSSQNVRKLYIVSFQICPWVEYDARIVCLCKAFNERFLKMLLLVMILCTAKKAFSNVEKYELLVYALKTF